MHVAHDGRRSSASIDGCTGRALHSALVRRCAPSTRARACAQLVSVGRLGAARRRDCWPSCACNLRSAGRKLGARRRLCTGMWAPTIVHLVHPATLDKQRLAVSRDFYRAPFRLALATSCNFSVSSSLAPWAAAAAHSL